MEDSYLNRRLEIATSNLIHLHKILNPTSNLKSITIISSAPQKQYEFFETIQIRDTTSSYHTYDVAITHDAILIFCSESIKTEPNNKLSSAKILTFSSINKPISNHPIHFTSLSTQPSLKRQAISDKTGEMRMQLLPVGDCLFLSESNRNSVECPCSYWPIIKFQTNLQPSETKSIGIFITERHSTGH